MRAKREGEALVERNDYDVFSTLCGQLPPQLTLKKRPNLSMLAGFEATPPLAGRRSGHKGANLPTVFPSTLGLQGPLQRP